jgi:hypothetical protein
MKEEIVAFLYIAPEARTATADIAVRKLPELWVVMVSEIDVGD